MAVQAFVLVIQNLIKHERFKSRNGYIIKKYEKVTEVNPGEIRFDSKYIHKVLYACEKLKNPMANVFLNIYTQIELSNNLQ